MATNIFVSCKTAEESIPVCEATEQNTQPTKTTEELKDELCDSLFSTRLPIDILIDRIKGLIYGCIIGECYNNTTNGFKYLTEQLLMTMETVIEKGMYDPYTFIKKLKAYNGVQDTYTQQVLDTFDADSNARINSVDHYIKNEEAKSHIKTDCNVALVRVVPLCLFYNFDDLSLISCMTTHANPVCLVASVLFGTIIRNILIGRTISYEDIILCSQVSLSSAMKNVEHNEGYDNLVDFVPTDNYLDLNNLELDEDSGYVYKTLGVGIYALMKTVEQNIMDIGVETPVSDKDNFNNILAEIYSKGGDTINNCCVAGSIVGGYIGYSNLPLEKMPIFSEQDSLYIKNIISLYLRTFSIMTQ